MPLPYWKTCANKPSQRLVAALRSARRRRLPFQSLGSALPVLVGSWFSTGLQEQRSRQLIEKDLRLSLVWIGTHSNSWRNISASLMFGQ